MSAEAWIALFIGGLGIIGTVLGSVLWLGRRMGRIELSILTIQSEALPELKANQLVLATKVDNVTMLSATAKVERENTAKITKNHETRIRKLETSIVHLEQK